MSKPENLPLQVSKYFADLQTADAKYNVSVFDLRKVAERALEAWRKAEFPGADARPWLEKRVEQFLAAVHGDAETPDVDLLPHGHARRKDDTPDPWAELLSAEERIQALQKSLVESVTRVGVRKSNLMDLVKMNQRLAHLYEVSFAKNEREESVTGIRRAAVVEAAAVVHEELERRRAAPVAGDHPLYVEAWKSRAEARTTVYEGELLQHADGVTLRLSNDVELFVRGKSGGMSIEKAAERFSPAGSSVHPPFLEPLEAAYVGSVRAAGAAVSLGKFQYTRGAATDSFVELFVSGALRGVLVIGKSSLMLRKSLVPYVLTEQAVRSKYMPPEGESALPGSLEWDVPPELRYWRAAHGQDPREIRDQLVRTELFNEDVVQFVDGMPRRTFGKYFVADPYPAAPDVFAELLPEQRPEAELFASYVGEPRALFKALEMSRAYHVFDGSFDHDDHATTAAYLFEEGTEVQASELAHRFHPPETRKYLIGYPDSAEARKELEKLGRPFALPGVDKLFFVSSHPVSLPVVWLDEVLPVSSQSADAAIDKRQVRLVKASAEEDERYVLGIVLEPETVDAQSDIYSEQEVRKSAYRFMAYYQNAGLMHKTLINDAVRIVESYIAPVDCEVGGQPVKKGTWLMGMIVESDELWVAVKAGVLSGFSIGGSAIRTAEQSAA